MPVKPAANLQSILERPISEIVKPKPLPAAIYRGVVKKFETGTANTGTQFVEFQIAPIAPEGEIDEAALDAALTKGNGQKVPLSEKTLRHTFYITDLAAYRLQKFLNDCGIEDEGSLMSMMQEVTNREVLIDVKHEASRDPGSDVMFARIVATAKVK